MRGKRCFFKKNVGWRDQKHAKRQRYCSSCAGMSIASFNLLMIAVSAPRSVVAALPLPTSRFPGQERADRLRSLRDTLCLLSYKGLVVEAGNIKGMPMGNLMAKLEAWSYMCDSERWWAATKGMQFSDAVARTGLGRTRSRTAVERHAFMQECPILKAALDRSLCAFDLPTAKFGKKQRPEVDLKKCTFDVQRWAMVLSSYKLTSLPNNASTPKISISSKATFFAVYYPSLPNIFSTSW
jgi:hypothetical protein